MKQESNSAEEHDWASKDEPQEIEQAVAFALTGAPINTSNGLEHRVQSLPLHPRAERGSGRRFASLTACASRLVKKWKKRKFVHVFVCYQVLRLRPKGQIVNVTLVTDWARLPSRGRVVHFDRGVQVRPIPKHRILDHALPNADLAYTVWGESGGWAAVSAR